MRRGNQPSLPIARTIFSVSNGTSRPSRFRTFAIGISAIIIANSDCAGGLKKTLGESISLRGSDRVTDPAQRDPALRWEPNWVAEFLFVA